MPENHQSEPFLVPFLLETPPVKDHTALGLTQQILHVVNEAGVNDHQAQRGGVDGQYILMGVWDKILSLFDMGPNNDQFDVCKQSGDTELTGIPKVRIF